MPKEIFYFVICIMLIVVGVIITNLWLYVPFSFELLVQISSVTGSACTVIALIVAVRALNEWKRTYAYTKADTRFEELQLAYWDLSGAFNNFYYKEAELLGIKASNKYTDEHVKQLSMAEGARDAAQQVFQSEVTKFKKVYMQLQPSIYALDGNERNYLEYIDSDWWKVIQKLDFDSGALNAYDYRATLKQKQEAYSMLQDVNERNNCLLKKVREEIQGKLKV